jgi:hypothetical protein
MILPSIPLQIDADDDRGHWRLSFDAPARNDLRLRLTFRSVRLSDLEIIAAEIFNPAQIDALIDRVRDVDDDAHDLATELVDLLLTLSSEPLKPECIAFLVFRLCVWISDNRRAARASARAA